VFFIHRAGTIAKLRIINVFSHIDRKAMHNSLYIVLFTHPASTIVKLRIINAFHTLIEKLYIIIYA
jgi:hypothetical protein